MNALLEPPQGGLTKPSIVKTSQILVVNDPNDQNVASKPNV